MFGREAKKGYREVFLCK